MRFAQRVLQPHSQCQDLITCPAHTPTCNLQILLYVLDIVGSEGRDPLADFEILQRELELYARDRRLAGGLVSRPSLILANKCDLDPAKAAKNIERLRRATALPIFGGSAQRGERLAPVLTALRRMMLVELQPPRWADKAGPPKTFAGDDAVAAAAVPASAPAPTL